MTKSVCVLTNFCDYYSSYSLITVAERQVKMLTDAGYKPKVIVMESFKPEGAFANPDVELCKIPNTHGYNDWRRDETFDKDVEMIKEHLDRFLANVDVVLTHDLVYQAACWKYAVAARQIANERDDLRWLHLVHSATSQADHGKEPFPHSFVMFPNSYDIPRVAHAFGVEHDNVKVVPHAIDVCEFFGMHPLSEKVIREHDILSADVIMTYPLRLDRGKQPEVNIKVIAQLKKLGRSVRLIIMDFHSTGDDKPKYREELKALAARLGLTSSEVIFMSEQDEKLKLESPRIMVKDFMCISNVFLLPSKSETFSLVAQEAAITGNFLILNFDFLPMRSIYGDAPLYRKFSSNIGQDGMDGETTTTYGSEDDYMKDIAGYITYVFEHNNMVSLRTKIRREHNLRSVFKKHLEPLFYYEEK